MRVLHDDEWRDHDLAGERVGVVACGREAARIVPRLLDSATSVKVFQLEPAWVLPVRLPTACTVAARLNLRVSVKDPWTRRLLTPSRFADREVTLSRRYYDAIQRANCTLVDWPVYAVTEHGVRTAEGIEHRVDTLVLTAAARKELAA